MTLVRFVTDAFFSPGNHPVENSHLLHVPLRVWSQQIRLDFEVLGHLRLQPPHVRLTASGGKIVPVDGHCDASLLVVEVARRALSLDEAQLLQDLGVFD